MNASLCCPSDKVIHVKVFKLEKLVLTSSLGLCRSFLESAFVLSRTISVCELIVIVESSVDSLPSMKILREVFYVGMT